MNDRMLQIAQTAKKTTTKKTVQDKLIMSLLSRKKTKI